MAALYHVVFVFVLEHGARTLPFVFAGLVAAAAWFGRGALAGRRHRVGRGLAAVALLAAAAGTAGAFAFQHRIHRVLEQRVDGLRLELLRDGSRRTLADYRGRVVVLNFWATWCPPCRAEMPALDRLAADYGERGVVVLTASDEPRDTIARYATDEGLATEVARFTDAGAAPEGRIAAMAWAGRPTTLVLDRAGRVRRFLIAGQTFDRLAAAVDDVL